MYGGRRMAYHESLLLIVYCILVYYVQVLRVFNIGDRLTEYSAKQTAVCGHGYTAIYGV